MSEDELRLVHALQIAPRASWSALGPILGCDPVTAARRWARLEKEGLAWVTAYAGGGVALALVELRCAQGRTMAVADRLAADPEVITIDITVGGRDIVATVVAESAAGFTDYLLGPMTADGDITSTVTHILVGPMWDARVWRLQALNAEEVAAVEQLARTPPSSRRGRIDPEIEDGLVRELQWDGRASAADLAARLGVGPDRVRGTLTELIASRRIVLRTEIARPASGRSAYAWFFLHTPARMRDRVIERLSTMRDLRLIAAAVGPATIVLAMWLRSLDDIAKVEAVIERGVRDVEIIDRSVVLRTTKHLGRMIAPDGRSMPRPETPAD